MLQQVAAYRVLFIIAAAYNVVFSLASGCFPVAFFGRLGVAPPEAPLPWPVVASLAGLFSGLYVYAAMRPAAADLVVTIGLVGKVAGPLLWLGAVLAGWMSPRLFPIVLVGDLIWWFPLLSYLLRRQPWRPTVIAWLGVAAHLCACVALVAVTPGTELGGDAVSRQQWVQSHAGMWSATWMAWALASLSLLALVNAWANRLGKMTGSWRQPLLACGIVAVGVVCDLWGESIMGALSADASLDPRQFALIARQYQIFSPLLANGLYCMAGLLLSAVSWNVGLLRGGVGIVGFTMWIVGLALTIASEGQHTIAMVTTGAAVMILYILFASQLGWRLRPLGSIR